MRACLYPSIAAGSIVVALFACGHRAPPAPVVASAATASSSDVAPSVSSAPPATTHYAGIAASPQELCARLEEVLIVEDGVTPAAEKKEKDLRDCADELRALKTNKPDLYQCYSACILAESATTKIGKCLSTCDGKSAK